MQQNRLTGDSFGPLPERGAFVCRIPKLPLPASMFRVGFSLTSEAKGGRSLDAIEHAIDLPVETGDFFGSGALPAVQRGVCLVDASWRLDRDATPAPSPLTPTQASL